MSDLKSEAETAAGLCKVDLITDMVREFPALQGRMGGLYARAEGYPDAVWRAVYEHYLPLSLDGPLPETPAGSSSGRSGFRRPRRWSPRRRVIRTRP